MPSQAVSSLCAWLPPCGRRNHEGRVYAIAPSNSRMAALIAGLKSGHIRAAGLDVYDGEPKVNLTLENVTLLPHLGSATRALENLDAVLLKGTAAPE